jgi:hypothetical protein
MISQVLDDIQQVLGFHDRAYYPGLRGLNPNFTG